MKYKNVTNKLIPIKLSNKWLNLEPGDEADLPLDINLRREGLELVETKKIEKEKPLEKPTEEPEVGLLKPKSEPKSEPKEQGLVGKAMAKLQDVKEDLLDDGKFNHSNNPKKKSPGRKKKGKKQ